MAQNVVINGTTYNNVPRIDIPKSGGGTAKFYDTSSADGIAGNVLTGKIVYGAEGPITGSMSNNGTISETIAQKDQTVTLSAGYISGGSIRINTTEQAKIIASNIKSGVTILGVPGSLTSATISQDSTTHVLSIS